RSSSSNGTARSDPPPRSRADLCPRRPRRTRSARAPAARSPEPDRRRGSIPADAALRSAARRGRPAGLTVIPSAIIVFLFLAQEPGAQKSPAREAPREGEWGQAPDGERGFGPGRTLRDLTKLLRSPAEEDRGFLQSLFKLEDDLRVLLSLSNGRYKAAGY